MAVVQVVISRQASVIDNSLNSVSPVIIKPLTNS